MAKLGEMLLNEGLVTREQLLDATNAQRTSGAPLGQELVRRGVLTEAQLVDALSRQTGYPQFESDPRHVSPALAQVIPVELAARLSCAPLMLTGQVLSVGLLDPENARTVDHLAQITGKTIKACIISSESIRAVWKQLYGTADISREPKGVPQLRERTPSKQTAQSKGQAANTLSSQDAKRVIAGAVSQIPEETNAAKEDLPELSVCAEDPPVIQMVNALLMEALQARASDIHFEPYPEALRARFRIDGELRTMHELPSKSAAALISRLKVLASLDIAEKRFPQDGRIKLALQDKGTIDFRVSTLPSIHGEKIVMRVLGTGSLRNSVEDLGFRGKALQYVRESLKNSFGMILVTGPTGSGKTTTLYTMLKELSDPTVNIVTAEDPVEYNLPSITQVSVKPQIGFTFEVALRSFLRQDPDIILVGEMRDYETAAIAVKAALTGHLVFSTLHTNDAPSTVVRLVDMGIEPYLVSSAVKLVIAQRLIRKLCVHCKEETGISADARENLHESTLQRIEKTYTAKGCEKCGGSGYYGRMPVYEVMPIRSKELKRVITEGGTEVMVAQVARREGMHTLKDEALVYVNEGLTSLEEALQIILSE